ncbi:MAG: PKD domain-containing protein [Thermoplasmatota archaeon]
MRRRILVLAIVICLGCTMQPVDAAAETGVLVAAPAHAAPGDTFTVNVTVEPEEPLGGMECDILFNASVLEAQEIAAGELFEGWWNSSLTIDNDNGTVGRLLGFNYQGNETTMPGTFATVTFTAVGEGSGWIRLANVTLSDPAGNESVPSAITNDTVVVIDDTTPPELNYTLSPAAPDGENGWYVSPVNVSVTARDDRGVHSIGFHVGSHDWQTVSADSATFSVSQDGNHTVYLRATDVVGNTNTTDFPLKVDTTPPTSSCSVPGDIWRNDPTVTVDWQAADDAGLRGVTLWYRPAASTGSWQTASSAAADGSSDSGSLNLDLAGLDGEGLYHFATSASDRAGNHEETPTAADCECGYDGSPPTANVTLTGTELEPDIYEDSVMVQVTGDDSLSGVGVIQYMLDGSTWNTYENAFTVSSPGDHTLTYRAVDMAGNTGTSQHRSFEIAGHAAPVAAFSYAVQQDGRTVSFTDQSEGDIDQWQWTFGDGGTSSARNPGHTFPDSGTYTVTLTVSGPGGSNSASTAVQLQNMPPKAAFSVTPEYPLPGQDITFDGAASSDGDGSISDWHWDFGDGSSGTGEQVEHSYTSPGNYTVALTVTDNEGKSGSTEHVVMVNGAPVAAFDAPAAGLVGNPVNFTDRSSDDTGHIVNWTWDFGDGTNGYGPNVSCLYTAAGTYTVTLQVRDSYGATGTVSHNLTVRPRYEFSVTDIDYDGSLFGADDIHVSIANAGAETAENVACTLSIDGITIETKQTGQLASDGTATLSFTVDVSPLRGHTIKAVVDPDNEFPEGDETNNDLSVDVPMSWLLLALTAAAVAAIAGVAVFLYRRRTPAGEPRHHGVQVQDGRQIQRCFVCRGKLKADAAAVQCACGTIFHRSCAKRVGECPDCGRELDVSPTADAQENAG